MIGRSNTFLSRTGDFEFYDFELNLCDKGDVRFTPGQNSLGQYDNKVK